MVTTTSSFIRKIFVRTHPQRQTRIDNRLLHMATKVVGKQICKHRLLKQTASITYESVDAEKYEVDGDDDGALDVDDGTSHGVVVGEQVCKKSLLVRRVAKQIPRYTYIQHRNRPHSLLEHYNSDHIQANSASYPQRDGKWVPAKRLWSSAAIESNGRYGSL